MRILIIDTYYPWFLGGHYAARPGLDTRSYAEQLESLLMRCFGTSDAYSHYLRELGHESTELVANCYPLQRSWATEAGANWSLRALDGLAQLPGVFGRRARALFARRVALRQIEAFDADVVYLQDLWFLTRREIDALRHSGRAVVAQTASEVPPRRIVRACDMIFTSFPHFVERFKAMNIEASYLAIGFYEPVLERLQEIGVDASSQGPRPHAVSFVGGLDPELHTRGVELLEALCAEVPIEVWGYGGEHISKDSRLYDRYRGEAWGLEMYRVLAQSKIVVNRHIAAAEGYANNMRVFEATGAGALLITESAPNLPELFEPGREVITYEGAGDLLEKVRHYLAHEDERASIAAAGQARTLSEHTYQRRIAELEEQLQRHFAEAKR